MIKPDTDTPNYPRTYLNCRIAVSRIDTGFKRGGNKVYRYRAAALMPNGNEACCTLGLDTEAEALQELVVDLSRKMLWLEILEKDIRNALHKESGNEDSDATLPHVRGDGLRNGEPGPGD